MKSKFKAPSSKLALSSRRSAVPGALAVQFLSTTNRESAIRAKNVLLRKHTALELPQIFRFWFTVGEVPTIQQTPTK